MPGPSNTLLIEGSFSELSEELAQFIDGVAKAEEGAGLRGDIKSSIEELQQIEQAGDAQSADQTKVQQLKDDILKKVVTKAADLNKAPEKGSTTSLPSANNRH
jgi:translation initiation factor 3 subunit M